MTRDTMHIDAVDFYYLSMPEVLDIGDGSQDALLVRIQVGPYVGWGECEASPLVSIASLVCPMSHSACKPVRDSVLGQPFNDKRDIYRINALVHANSLDLLQAPHTLSGLDIALWDIYGKMCDTPVYELLGYDQAYAKMPYASQLFGDTPEATYEKALRVRGGGFRAAKFGWGPYGLGSVAADAAHVYAAREGLGADGVLLIDAGTVWLDDVDVASTRLAALNECRVTWLEEPFVSGALKSYATLARLGAPLKLAGGEGCHTYHMAQHMIDYAQIGYIQIDTGRIGGISTAHQVAQYAQKHAVTYVNHTFTSNLALSASLQPYAGIASDVICEYPVELKQLAYDMTVEHIVPDQAGMIHIPAAPGLGITPNLAGIAPYVVPCEIRVRNTLIYQTPPLHA
jgi:L-alanine-DL-glutamate epimerase-like enolase superfamily enzyme